MPQSAQELVTNALVLVGANNCTIGDGSKEDKATTARLTIARRSLLRMHPWNFSIKRDKLVATKKAITNVVDNGSSLFRVTAVGHGRANNDWVEIAEVQGSTGINGRWKVTVINADTLDLQGSTFAGTYVSGGKLWLSLPHGYSFVHSLPSDYMRMRYIDPDIDYRIESGKLVTDEETVEIRYIAEVTDYLLMDTVFYEALAYYLAWTVALRLSASQEIKEQLWSDLQAVLAKAKSADAQEEPTEDVNDYDWLQAHDGLNRGFVRDPMT